MLDMSMKLHEEVSKTYIKFLKYDISIFIIKTGFIGK
jgi:hypothetical protein